MVQFFVTGWRSQVARRSHKPQVAGSKPAPVPNFKGSLAQLGERLICIQEAGSSILPGSTKFGLIAETE